jgi:hypothetical protein
MITAFDIYLVGLVDKVILFSLILSIISFIAALVVGIHSVVGCPDDKCLWEVTYLLQRIVVFGLLSSAIFVITPSSKTLTAMYAIPPIVNSDKTAQLTEKSYKALNNLLDKYAGENHD